MIAIVVAAMLLATASPVPAQPTVPVQPATVPIAGALVRPGAARDAAARGRLSRESITATDPDKRVSVYEGVRVADVLRDAGASVGDAVRGQVARAYVVVTASDRYSVVFSLAELQTAESRCAPIVADTRDGNPLGVDVGPLRIVAPCDLTHARWVRGVSSLSVVVVPGEPPAAGGMHH
ncbi:MAG: molybdopterin-dependent oxidoreductase [Candidatus Eremiobacteraeota bacterium]|nr:molybdopterin-dependent oxidoreductase [Candidatus Eremiobacteraeota bacterium]